MPCVTLRPDASDSHRLVVLIISVHNFSELTNTISLPILQEAVNTLLLQKFKYGHGFYIFRCNFSQNYSRQLIAPFKGQHLTPLPFALYHLDCYVKNSRPPHVRPVHTTTMALPAFKLVSNRTALNLWLDGLQ